MIEKGLTGELSSANASRALRLRIVFASNQDVNEWEQRFERGAATTRWPYSLHLLQEEYDVEAVTTGRPRLIELVQTLLRIAASWDARAAPNGDRSPDVGFAWDENLAVRLVGKRRGRVNVAGTIWISDDVARRRNWLRRLLVHPVLKSLDAVFVQSTGQLEPVRRWLGPRVTVRYVPMSVDEEFYRPSPYPTTPLILSLGNDKDRDPLTLALALEELHRTHPKVEVVVQSSRVELLPANVQVVERLPIADIRALYERASLVVVATEQNLHVSGITVALEAMASARPVVVTETPGMREYIEDGSEGRLIRPGDWMGFAEAMRELLDEPIAARAMGVKGRQAVEDRFNARAMNEGISQLVQSAWSRGPRYGSKFLHE